MKNYTVKTKVLDVVSHDRELLALFGGILLVAVAMLSLAITAGVWYL
jgi:hypothetical protein